MKPSLRRVLVCTFAVLLAAPLRAHDFWIEPASYRPPADGLLRVGLRVGDLGKGDGVPRSDERIVAFVCAGPSGDKPIVGRDGGDPAGMVRLGSDGLYVLGYRSSPASVELAAEKFEAYLRERGLDQALALRTARGEGARPGREIYSRCSKSIVSVGAGSSTGFDHMLGFTLELIPERNPCGLRGATAPGTPEPLPVRLYFEGKPLPNALVGALCLDEPPKSAEDPLILHARTDADGRARLELPRGGRWLLSAVHMIRIEGNEKADWESFWASLTFET